MLYQGKQLTQPAPAVSENQAHLSDFFGISNERHEQISEALENHALDCFHLEGERKGFDSSSFLVNCHVELQTPQEVAYAGFVLAAIYQRYDRMIEVMNMIGSLSGK